MDPISLLEVLAVAVGGVAVVGGGAWAVLRGRRGRDRDRDTRDGTTPGGSDAPRGTTATKERPAAPTWDESFTAPAPPRTRPEDGAPGPSGTAEPADAAPAPADTAEPADAAAGPAGTAESTDAPAVGTTAPTAPSDAPAPADTGTPAPPTPPDAAQQGGATAPATPDTGAQRPVEPRLDTPEPPADRLVRLRDRLSRSGSLGRGVLGLLSRERVDEDTWDEIEETLLLADLGPGPTDELLENLRRRMQVLGQRDPEAVREVLREELVTLVDPTMDRRLAATALTAEDGTTVPSVMLMVGVNGTGKTTTVGKLARVLVAQGRTVVLGAADTFRAAAADQLATWGSRVGVRTVRSDKDGADPAAVAFDAVREGTAEGVDVVIIDTAGRLQNKKGLMDELGKVRRVAEKGLHGVGVQEVLLVLDATTGQNGLQQARVFSEAVQITGLVLTKLDGTAKGGIVVNVQRELGVPVKMVGLGEGMDDLAPFDAHGFVDALLDA
ncbi:signal recognition particle-docking protein FtsY [Brachybacterium sp. AOP25-B2-12]|uniref:signal recognition particle-docking protein FtsY n=1 Tax=Brachybacterium sp. AOP25-B2-12 TaxID=3457710 RepID=UPI004033186B